LKNIEKYYLYKVASTAADAGKALAAGQPAPSVGDFFSNPPGGQKAPVSSGPAGANAPGDEGAPVTPVDTQQQAAAPSVGAFFGAPKKGFPSVGFYGGEFGAAGKMPPHLAMGGGESNQTATQSVGDFFNNPPSGK